MDKEQLSAAFLQLIKDHKGILYKITNSYCRDAEDRKDLLQEIIVQLWNSFGKYDAQYKYSTWVYRIALNVYYAIAYYAPTHLYFIFSVGAISLINIIGFSDYIRHLILTKNIHYDGSIVEIQEDREYIVFQLSLTASFTYLSYFLYINHKPESLSKKWFRVLIAGSGGKSVAKAIEFYKELEEFKKAD